VAIAPGPAETFGLAALEALACGTPVVVSDAGASVPSEDLAAGVGAVLARPERSRRAAARARAEQYDWGTAARGFLAAHGAEDSAAIRRRSA
jgi:alpha-1,6-mannosyltransferase